MANGRKFSFGLLNLQNEALKTLIFVTEYSPASVAVRVVSSVVEHRLHTAGVGGSKPSPRTKYTYYIQQLKPSHRGSLFAQQKQIMVLW